MSSSASASLSSLSRPLTFHRGFHDEQLCHRMEYRPLGRTGMQVSKLSLGGGTFSRLYGNLDVNEAIATIHKALKVGINYIDTAPFYGEGESERVLGLALRDVPRDAYYIATKVGRYGTKYETMFDYSALRTRQSVDRSLALLGVNYIDVIQIHDIEFAPDLDVIVNECLPALEGIVREGKARFIGITGYPLTRLKKCIELAPGRFDIVLSYARYTLLDDTLKSYMEFFRQQKVGVICASVLALGLLTNGGPQPWHPLDDVQKEQSKKAVRLCHEADVELARLALHHAVQLSDVTSFLLGMQTRQLLDANLDVFHRGLTAQEQEVLQLLRRTVFTKSTNWEGIELTRYEVLRNAAIRDIENDMKRMEG